MKNKLVWSSLVIAVSGIPLAGCDSTVDAVSDSVSDAIVDAVGTDPALSAWQIESQIDPMTDEKNVSAVHKLEAGGYAVTIKVQCRNDRDLKYTIKATHPEGSDAEMPRVYQVRIDGNDPERWVSIANGQTRLNIVDLPVNAASVRMAMYSGESADSGQHALKLARASTAVIRLGITEDSVTIKFDQRGEEVRGVLDPCIANAVDASQFIPADEIETTRSLSDETTPLLPFPQGKPSSEGDAQRDAALNRSDEVDPAAIAAAPTDAAAAPSQ